eukprot:scaffold9874_cov116-Isochrysis_galbana.AAC.4
MRSAARGDAPRLNQIGDWARLLASCSQFTAPCPLPPAMGQGPSPSSWGVPFPFLLLGVL